MPHLAEEIWHALGHQTLVADATWPVFEPGFLEEEMVTLAVQVNGKLHLEPEGSERNGSE